MLEMVETRRNVVEGEERYDLFSSLLDAAQNEQDSGMALSDDELIGGSLMSQSISTLENALPVLLGNMFIFLLAGHEVGLTPPPLVTVVLL